MIEPGPPCSEQRLKDAEDALGARRPEQIRQLFSGGDGRYRPDGEWWVIWPLDRLLTDNVGAWERGELARELLAFGDDGTGAPFCVPMEGADAVVRWSWIGWEICENEGTMSAFLSEWVV